MQANGIKIGRHQGMDEVGQSVYFYVVQLGFSMTPSFIIVYL